MRQFQRQKGIDEADGGNPNVPETACMGAQKSPGVVPGWSYAGREEALGLPTPEESLSAEARQPPGSTPPASSGPQVGGVSAKGDLLL